MTPTDKQFNERMLDIFDKHTEQDDTRFENIEVKLDVIKDNHLAHIQADMAKQTANVDWLMKFFWVILTASVGGIIANVINLIQH
jgi:hypothetical protein